MKLINAREEFLGNRIGKPDFIRAMYEEHHSKLFDYAAYLKLTNIAAIEITDDSVVMITRDKGIRVLCPVGDHRSAPVESLNFLDYEGDDFSMIMRMVAPPPQLSLIPF